MMLLDMQAFSAFMNVESTRSYIDDLYSQDSDKCLHSIICIKNSVIGSNRRKESVIAQGIVPRLIFLLNDRNMKSAVRVEAAVTIGSLAKGTKDHIDLLINSGIVETLLGILDIKDSKLIDVCISCLRTLSNQDPIKVSSKLSCQDMKKLLALAESSDNIQRQSSIATILAVACRTSREQLALCSCAPEILAPLLTSDYDTAKIPVLTCLSAMCFNCLDASRRIASVMCQEGLIPVYASTLMARDKPVEMQLEAAKFITNIYRSGAIEWNSILVLSKAIPCLVRLCQLDYSEVHRAAAAETLAYLTEVDCNLQQIAAISNHLISALVDLLKCPSVAARTSAFRAFASLGANDEEIRKRIIDTKCLMERLVEGLSDPNKEINLASVKCLHSLSRSVQQLRTTFQDHSVWRPLMTLLTDELNPPSQELLIAASSTLCNLLLEFSPAKEPILQQGAIKLLSSITSSPDAALRLNGVWALMNLAFQAEQRVKTQILNALGTDQIFRLLADPDTRVLMKTLGLLRNLVSPNSHTDTMMSLHGPQVMQGVVLVLEGPHSPEVKEQALLILSNVADGDRARDHIMTNDDILKKLVHYMTHPAPCLQESAVFCIGNLTRRGEAGALERQKRLKEIGVLNILEQLLGTPDRILFTRVKSTLSNFSDLLINNN